MFRAGRTLEGHVEDEVTAFSPSNGNDGHESLRSFFAAHLTFHQLYATLLN